MSETAQLEQRDSTDRIGDPWDGPGDGATGSVVAAVVMVVLLVGFGPWIGIDWRLVALFAAIAVVSVVVRFGVRRQAGTSRITSGAGDSRERRASSG